VQAAGELDGDMAQVVRDDVEQAAGGEQRKRALERLEQRDCAQSLVQAAVQR